METEGPTADDLHPTVIDLLSDSESTTDKANTREVVVPTSPTKRIEVVGEELDESEESDGIEDGFLWDCESLFSDALEGMGDEQLFLGGKTSKIGCLNSR